MVRLKDGMPLRRVTDAARDCPARELTLTTHIHGTRCLWKLQAEPSLHHTAWARVSQRQRRGTPLEEASLTLRNDFLPGELALEIPR